MVRVAAAAVVALGLAACYSSNPGSGASSTRLSSPGAGPVTNAGSKASDLRTRLDLLLAEHVIVVAKESVAAAYHSDEYAGYAGLLTTNGSALAGVMRSAFGNSAATQFEQVWAVHDGSFVDYAIGLVTHNDTKSNGAMSALLNGYVPQFARFVTDTTQLPLDPMTQLATDQVLETKAVIDDQAAQDYPAMYADLRTAYAHSARIGDALASRMVQKFPDKFPGNPSTNAVDLRVILNDLLQEHAYLATMATDAIAAGREGEQTAASSALTANADALGTALRRLLGNTAGTRFAQLWSARDAGLVAYATSADAGEKQRLAGSFVSQFANLVNSPSGLGAAVHDQVLATIKVIDDQRAKAFAPLAGDDRAAAAAMQPIADAIVAAAVAQRSAELGA
ncbi:hypothetical protein EPN29_12425 [bacterium]|nr:MAG: hypothetical protein EPN29_12425 [bacterium]